MYGKGPFGKAFDVAAQVKLMEYAPVCHHESMFVSLSPEMYRCVNMWF